MRRRCLNRECRAIFEVTKGKQSYCPSCERQRRRDAPPRDAEPWRRLYKMRWWYIARARVLRRDERCRAVIGGVRCATVAGLEVHHDPPLDELWRQAAGDFDLFVLLATDERHLYSLCRRHHAQADALRRSTRTGDWT